MVRHQFLQALEFPAWPFIRPRGDIKAALAYASGIGGGRAGVIETNFRERRNRPVRRAIGAQQA
jgi:ketol-acid reductoisomerase